MAVPTSNLNHNSNITWSRLLPLTPFLYTSWSIKISFCYKKTTERKTKQIFHIHPAYLRKVFYSCAWDQNNAYGYYAIIYVCVCIYNIFDSLLFIMNGFCHLIVPCLKAIASRVTLLQHVIVNANYIDAYVSMIQINQFQFQKKTNNTWLLISDDGYKKNK